MMREPHPTELLSAYFDRELSRVERARIESHLAGCDECRALLDDWERLAAAQRGDVPPVPERLAARIEERVFGARPAPRPRRTFGWVRQVSLAAAALVVVGVVAGYFALRGGPGTGGEVGAPVPGAPARPVAGEATAPPPPPATRETALAPKRGPNVEARAPQAEAAGAAKGAFAPAPPLPVAAPEAASSAAEEAAPAAAGGAAARTP
ncbi:zf-HC2 domain-containing protein, partial [bacterium]|nr:zf-HC2 domain-containing protein [bacterium]